MTSPFFFLFFYAESSVAKQMSNKFKLEITV